jgi:hypothetical protein
MKTNKRQCSGGMSLPSPGYLVVAVCKTPQLSRGWCPHHASMLHVLDPRTVAGRHPLLHCARSEGIFRVRRPTCSLATFRPPLPPVLISTADDSAGSAAVCRQPCASECRSAGAAENCRGSPACAAACVAACAPCCELSCGAGAAPWLRDDGRGWSATSARSTASCMRLCPSVALGLSSSPLQTCRWRGLLYLRRSMAWN